jgi:subtilisin family serine protease
LELSVKLKNGFLTFFLSFILAAAGTFPSGARAQTDQVASASLALDTKADKFLKHIFHAASQAALGRVNRAAQQEAAHEVEHLSRLTGVRLNADGTVSVGLIVQLSTGSGEELKAAGFAVGAVVGDIATVETDASRLPELASLASVKRMWASVYRRPVNDRARQTAGIDNLSGQRVVSQTGAGVVVGVIDSGIDFRHPDFTVPGSGGKQTRIKFLLDMTGGPTNWNFTLPGGTAKIGTLYTASDINAALAESPKPAQSSDLVKQRDKNGHGTHVAGTAAGNGLGAPSAPGVYAGMAPAADLVVVKASRQDDGTASFGTNDMINAMKFIQAEAAALGEPFVVNLSIGGQAGPHDGTDPDEITIDNITNSAAGSVFCVAAGNEGSDSVHASTAVPAGGSVQLHFNANKNPNFIDLYSNPRGTGGSGRYTVTLTEPDGTQLGPLNFSATGFNQSSGQLSDSSVQLWDALDNKGDSDPSNDQADVFMLFKSGAKTGTWTITLTNGSGEPDSTFDAWADGDDVSFADFVDNNSHLVSSPGTSRGAITVGAYVARSATQTIGGFAFFTSPGPTADGRQKPEISADGYYLYSSRTSDWNSTNGVPWTYGSGPNALAAGVDQNLYGGLAGTSMATPVTTGSVALLLQANRNLSAGDIKALIENNATHDQFDPAGWNPHFGFGKLNIAAAVSAVAPPAQSNPIDTTDFFVRQHYADFLNRTPDASGLQFWTNNIESCGADQNCRAVKRVDTSAAFFLSIEFQQTGYLVYKMYRASFGNLPGKPVAVQRASWLPDTQSISSGVVVGQTGWEAQLENNKQAFALNFVQRAPFQSAHGGQDAATLVNSLFANAGVTPTDAERSTAVNAFNNAGGGNAGRAAALRSVAESASVSAKLFNEAFVLMEYFGYLQRDPDAAPEPTLDFSGYNFWLSKLNQFNGNYVQAQMVKAFLDSAEYRSRFGQP